MPEINADPPLLWDKLLSEFPLVERTLPRMLHTQAFYNSGRTLYEFHDFKVTYAQAESIAARGAQTLANAGVSRGDRVALICNNVPEFFEVFLGATWLGAVAVPLNTAVRGVQLEHMLTNSGATLLVAQEEYLARLEQVRLSSTCLSHVLAITDTLAGEISVAGINASVWELSDSESVAATIAPGDPLAILYTSGTTGVSKGVVCSHAQYFWWAYHNANILELAAGDRLHTTLPAFHTNALSSFFQALLTGSSVYFGNRFSASRFLDSIRLTGANVTYLLGAMVPILLTTPPSTNDRNHNLRVILAPGVPAEKAKEFEDRFGTILLDGFASTESNFVIGATYSDRKVGTMGRVRPGFFAKVADEIGEEVPDGTAGELLLRAEDCYAFSSGYYEMPEKTIESWKHLWLHTGDRVVRDNDGYFTFKDRIKDVIRRRGENISSFEVEQAIVSHPAIKTAAVYPVRSELAEDEVMVSVVLRAGHTLTPNELMDHCQPLISYFAVPRFVDFVESLPMTENGKVKKFLLRERSVTPTTWDRECSNYQLVR